MGNALQSTQMLFIAPNHYQFTLTALAPVAEATPVKTPALTPVLMLLHLPEYTAIATAPQKIAKAIPTLIQISYIEK